MNEKELIEKTAKAIQGYLIGCDIVDKKPKIEVLEKMIGKEWNYGYRS